MRKQAKDLLWGVLGNCCTDEIGDVQFIWGYKDYRQDVLVIKDRAGEELVVFNYWEAPMLMKAMPEVQPFIEYHRKRGETHESI